MAKSATATKITTPKGKLEWVFFSGAGKENKHGKFKYQASVVVPEAEAKVLTDKIDEFWLANKPKGAKKPATKGYRNQSVKSDQVDEYGDAIYEDVPGMIEFFVSTNATWPDGSARKIGIYNAKGAKVDLTKKIGNGSIGKLAAIMDIYDVAGNQGVNLYFSDIQLFTFEEYQEGPSFEEDEDADGGWTGEEEANAFTGEDEPADEPKTKVRL